VETGPKKRKRCGRLTAVEASAAFAATADSDDDEIHAFDTLEELNEVWAVMRKQFKRSNELIKQLNKKKR
jgi:hypothetical protein